MAFGPNDNAAGSKLNAALVAAGYHTSDINAIFTDISYSPTLINVINQFDAAGGVYVAAPSTVPNSSGGAAFGAPNNTPTMSIAGPNNPNYQSYSGSFTNPFAIGPAGQATGEAPSGTVTTASSFVGTISHELGHFLDYLGGNPLFFSQSGTFSQLVSGYERLWSEGFANEESYTISEEIASNTHGAVLVPVPDQDSPQGGYYTYSGSLQTEQNIYTSGQDGNILAIVLRYAGDTGTLAPSSSPTSPNPPPSYAEQAFGYINSLDPNNLLPFSSGGKSNVVSTNYSYSGPASSPTDTVTITFNTGLTTTLIFHGNTVTRSDSSGYQHTYAQGTGGGLINSLLGILQTSSVVPGTGFGLPQSADDLLSNLSQSGLTTQTSGNPDGSTTTSILSGSTVIATMTSFPNGPSTLKVVDSLGATQLEVDFATSDLTQNFKIIAYGQSPDQISQISSYGVAAVLTTQTTNYTNYSSTIIDYNPADLLPGQVSVETHYSGLGGNGNKLWTNARYQNSSSVFTDLVTGIVVNYDSSKEAVSATTLNSEGSAIGGALGSVLGSILDGNNIFGKLVLTPALQAVGESFGEFAQTWIDGANDKGANFETALAGGVDLLPSNIETSSLSEVAGYLFGELINEIGIKGEAAGLVDAIGGTVTSVFAQNVVRVANGVSGAGYFNGLSGPQFYENIGSAVGAYLGSQLAQAILTPTTDGGQIGEQIGSALGGVAATIAIADGLGTALLGDAASSILADIAIGAAFGFVGAFVGAILGTLIGDVFGEAPSPQAYDNITLQNGPHGETFVGSFRSQKDGGPIASAASIANAITTELNTIVQESGGKLSSATQIPLFVVGIRKGTAELIDNHDHKFYGSNGVQQLINYAILSRIGQLVIVGGDMYIKRAIAATAAGAFDSNGNLAVDTNAIAGNIKIAQDYEFYLNHEADVNAIIAGAPQSAAALGWAAELSEALALGLNKRGFYDWNGGWDGFLQGLNASPLSLAFSDAGNIRLITNMANNVVTADSIDSNGKTIIQGANTAGQVITVNDSTLQLPNVGSLTANGTLVTAPVTIPIAAAIYGGNGAGDVIYAGNQGNDVFGGSGGTAANPDSIYGYSSPTDQQADATWIFGGSGSNYIKAGNSYGDYIKGGTGSDTIDGTLSHSIWIDGNTGSNSLTGGTGNDVIQAEGASTNGSAFYNDTMLGWGGNDTYIVAPGIDDTINNAPQGSLSAAAAGTIELTGIAGFDQLKGSVSGGNLTLTLYGASTTSTVQSGNYVSFTQSHKVIEQIVIDNQITAPVEYLQLASNGEEINISNFGTRFITGTPGSDFLEGYPSGHDSIFGGGGTDTIEGFSTGNFIVGSGILSGGNEASVAGGDTILGQGNDTIFGGSGANLLDGGPGTNFILGNAFDTIAADVNTIHGGATAAGTSTVIGGAEGNLFQYDVGDGSELLVSALAQSAWQTAYLTTAGGFQAGYGHDASGDLTYTANGSTTILFNPNTNMMNGVVDVVDNYGTLTANQGLPESAIYWQPTLTTASNTKDILQFAPNITQGELLFEKNGANLIIGINDGNTNPAQPAGSFASLADEITIRNYFTSGAIGTLQVMSSSGTMVSVALSGAGAVTLAGPTSSSGSGTVAGNATAASWITGGFGNYTLVGGAGNDTLTAGADGIDTLEGGAGTNTLLGTGQTFASYQEDTTGTGVTATLANETGTFGTQKPAGAVSNQARTVSGLARINVDVPWLRFLSGWISEYDGPQRGIPSGQQTAGGKVSSTYTNTGLAAGDSYSGITGLIGSIYGDTLVAGPSNTVQSTLDGGGGSDLLVGGPGNDDFIYSVAQTGTAAYGSDTIQLNGGADTLDIQDIGGPGVTFDNLAFASNGGSLTITDGPTHTITLLGLTGSGQTLTLSLDGDISATFSGLPISGNSGLAVAPAGNGARVSGGPTATVIVGNGSGDVLTGVSGQDTFEAGAGNDSFAGANSNVATIATANTASFDGLSTSVTVALANGNSTLAAGGAAGDSLRNIQNLTGTSANDVLTGDANANDIDGGTGNDIIVGGGGNDTLIGNGLDTITSGVGNALISVGDCTLTGAGSSLTGGAGDDTIYGGAGNDTITDTGSINGTVLSSSIDGYGGNDYITGFGNDTLNGGGGNDTIIGTGGNSLIEDGGGGAHLIVVSGNDTVSAGAGGNTIAGGLTSNVVEISNEAIGANGSQQAINAAQANHLFGAGLTWNSSTGSWVFVAPPSPLTAGNDTFELSAQSGTTTVWANYGVNEIDFDGSVNYENLIFTRDVANNLTLDITDPAVSATGTPFEIQLQNFFTGTMQDPTLRDITDNGEVLFLSGFVNNGTITTWEVPSNGGTLGAGTLALGWHPIGAATTNPPTKTAEDSLTGSTSSTNVILGSEYNSVIWSSDAHAGYTDTLEAGTGINVITASTVTGVAALIVGGPVADSLYGGAGNNTIDGGSGAEYIQGGGTAGQPGTYTNLLNAGSGADTIYGGANANTITGGAGADMITGGAFTNVINGGSGAETIIGATLTGGQFPGNTTINAGTGPEMIFTGSGLTVFHGGTGQDSIVTGTGFGTLDLSGGMDNIYAVSGVDTIDMTASLATGMATITAGNDAILQGAEADTVYGTSLTTVSFATFATGVVVNAQSSVPGGGVTDVISGVGTIRGGSGSDSLTASNTAQASLYGGGGNDTLVAGAGSDTLENGFNSSGVAGNDIMYGAPVSTGTDVFKLDGGTNLVFGGLGNNQYIISGSGNDTINQAARTGTAELYDVVTLTPGTGGTLSVYGPPPTGSTTPVGTEIAFESTVGTSGTLYAPYYDLWFQQSNNDLIVDEFGATGVQEKVDLVGWFSNQALQANPMDQLFDVGLVGNNLGTYGLLDQMLPAYHTSGLAVLGLIALDSSVAMPSNAASALALYTAAQPNAYHTQLDEYWLLNTPPTLTIVGSNTGTITEEIPTSPGPSTLTFQVQVADAESPTALTISAVNLLGASDGAVTVGTIANGIANVTLTLNQALQANGGQDFLTGNIPIGLYVTDADGAVSATQTFTATVNQVQPPPSFLGSLPNSITMYEGNTATAWGASSIFSFSVYDVSPTDMIDTGAVTVTGSDSAWGVGPNIVAVNQAAGQYTLQMFSLPNVYSQPGAPTSLTLTASILAANGTTVTTTQVIPVAINEVAVPPTLSTPVSETYLESESAQTFYIPISYSDSNAAPTVTVSSPANTSWWLSPVLPSGSSTITLTVAAGSWTVGNGSNWAGSVVVTATSNQGSLGSPSTTQTISIYSDYQHFDFSVPASASLNLAENSGVGVLTGIYTVPITNSNNDTFTYSIVGGYDPTNGSGTPDFTVTNTGIVEVNNPIAWIPGGNNTYTLPIQVSNGAYTHTDNVTVNVTDNSIPQETVQASGDFIIAQSVDPHGLAITFSVVSVISPVGNTYWVSTSSGPITQSGLAYPNEYLAFLGFTDKGSKSSAPDLITVRATDSQGIWTQQQVSYNPADAPPIGAVDPGANQLSQGLGLQKGTVDTQQSKATAITSKSINLAGMLKQQTIDVVLPSSSTPSSEANPNTSYGQLIAAMAAFGAPRPSGPLMDGEHAPLSEPHLLLAASHF